jgi:hypothetical protein
MLVEKFGEVSGHSSKSKGWGANGGLRTAIKAVWLTGICAFAALAQTNVTTQHNDISRTGANTQETILTPANVNSTSFGKLFTQPIDGYAYAQPLYVSGVTMGAGTPQAGTKHNVVFVATEHDSVYAFDADSNGGANASPLWHVTLLDAAHGAASGATSVPSSDVGTSDIVPEVGVTGTPVIDATTNTIYVVGKTKENGTYVQRLHALDITTGNEKFGGPVALSGSVSGSGNGSSGGVLHWDPKWENQRPGLLLLNGIVYIGFAAHGDNGPWHGWVLAYRASNLQQQTSAYCASPNGLGSGIWMSGSGLAADIADPANHPYGRMFIATGNGTYDALTPFTNNMDYGDDHVRLDLTNGVITVQDSFTPKNQATLNGGDEDLGAGGILLLPNQTSGGHQRLLLQLGKEGKIYLVDRDNMGGYSTSTDNVVQEVTNATGGVWGMPAYWNGNVYIWGKGNAMAAYSLQNGLLSTSPTSKNSVSTGNYSPTPSVTSNGNTNGIVWGVRSDTNLILYAYDATNLAKLLYASTQNLPGDSLGGPVKFNVPTIVNGKVYFGSQKQLNVFGLLSTQPQAATPVINPAGQSFAGSVSVTISDNTPGASIYYTTNGTTPTTSSTLYTGAISVSTTETITAIASATGFLQSAAAGQTYTLQTQTLGPTFSPAGGTFSSTQTVSILDASPSPTIYYTTDGTTPSPGAGTTKAYSSPLIISATTTLKAVALSSGLSLSPVSSTTFTINLPGGNTDFSTGFGNASTSMTFNGSTGLDDIRLQLTNGGQNQAGSAFYKTPLNIQAFTTDFTLQLSNAGADGITFTIQGTGPTALGASGGGLGYAGIGKSVAIKFDTYSNSGEGTSSTGLYTNGASPTTPSTNLLPAIDLHDGATMSAHVVYDGTTLYLSLYDPVAIKTFTTKWTVNIPSIVGGNTAYVGFTGGTGGTTSSQKIGTWAFTSGTPGQFVAMPTISPVSGTYTLPVSVALSDSTANSTIYYTVDGSNPTTASTRYTGAINLSGSTTVKAVATASGLSASPFALGSYAIQAGTPILSPAPGTYSSAQSVSITDTTPNSTIYYTTNGSTPTPGASGTTQYTGAVSVSATTTVKAIATASGLANSTAVSGTYTISATATVATPVISPASGTYAGAQTVTISDATSGATIYYTTNGSTPTTASSKYSGGFTVNATTTVKAMAVTSGLANSAVQSASYTISPPAATPTISPASGTYASAQTVTISDATSGATIYYTTDGSTPTTSSTKYSGGGTVSATTTVKAIATASGFSTSAVASATLTIQTGGTTAIGFGSGFSKTGMQFNGHTKLNGNRLQLTDTSANNQAASAYWGQPVNVQTFTTDFTLQLTNPSGDGMTFTIQGAGPTAIGPSGGGLGYGPDSPGGSAGIGKSVAVKFDLYNNTGEGSNSTGLYTNGASPTTPATAIGNGVSLVSGHPLAVHMTYNGTTLTMTITDTTNTSQTFTKSWALNIPATVGGNTAYVGFTGGTGTAMATQEVVSWTYSAATPLAPKVALAFDTSKLPAASSGPTFRVFSAAGYADGLGTILDATKAGNSVTFTVNVPSAGTYDIKANCKALNTRGISQLSVNGTNVGSTWDQYAAAESYPTNDFGNFNFATAGNYSFKFTVTGKNASSTGYSISFDNIVLTPQ